MTHAPVQYITHTKRKSDGAQEIRAIHFEGDARCLNCEWLFQQQEYVRTVNNT